MMQAKSRVEFLPGFFYCGKLYICSGSVYMTGAPIMVKRYCGGLLPLARAFNHFF